MMIAIIFAEAILQATQHAYMYVCMYMMKQLNLSIHCIMHVMFAQVSVSSVELDSNSCSSRRGFRINVSTERSRPGLLVSVLEALEDLGLDVLDADISCADDTAFRFQALGGSGQQGKQQQQGGSVDEQMVQQAVLQAISKCMDDDDE
jgi:hypothetical protein